MTCEGNCYRLNIFSVRIFKYCFKFEGWLASAGISFMVLVFHRNRVLAIRRMGYPMRQANRPAALSYSTKRLDIALPDRSYCPQIPLL
jgi:hypothetical protein